MNIYLLPAAESTYAPCCAEEIASGNAVFLAKEGTYPTALMYRRHDLNLSSILEEVMIADRNALIDELQFLGQCRNSIVQLWAYSSENMTPEQTELFNLCYAKKAELIREEMLEACDGIDPLESSDPLLESARSYLKTLRIIQKVPIRNVPKFICPRCGDARIHPDCAKNSYSRYEEIYICSDCGRDEAMRDASCLPPLPLKEWSFAQDLEKHLEWTEEKLEFRDLMHADPSSVEAYVCCWFDAEEKFGVELLTDDFLNLYARYTPGTDTLSMYYIIVRGDCSGDEGPVTYLPTEKERKLVISMMESACQTDCGCSLAEFVKEA